MLWYWIVPLLITIVMNFVLRKWQRPSLYGKGLLKDFIESRSKIVHEVYKPPLLCLNPFIQFYVRTMYEKPPSVNFLKSVLNLQDGGQVAFDEIELKDTTSIKSSPLQDTIVIVIPGLRESTHSPKIISTAYALLQNNASRVYILNARAACSIPLKSKCLTFAFGKYNHVNEAVDHVTTMYPEKKILLVGACLGSMQAIDYLSTPESNIDALLGAVCHSCTWELKPSESQDVSEPGYSLFTKKLVKDNIKRLLGYANDDERKLKEEIFEEYNIDIEQVKKSKTIWDLEEYFVAKITGLKNAQEYYYKISPKFKCHNVKKPLIVINSRDDSIIGVGLEKMDLAKFVTNPNMVLWSTAAGGHVSFIEGLRPVRSYLNRVIPESSLLLRQFVEETKQ